MGVRDAIRSTPVVSVSIAGGLIVVALVIIVFQVVGGQRSSAGATEWWYTSDDGATWFADRANKLPFERDGKPVYRAHVFDDGGGKPFLGFLERYSPAMEPQLKALRGSGDVPPAEKKGMFGQLASISREVKRAGAPASEWVSMQSGVGMRVTHVPARSGSTKEAEEVLP